MKKIQIKPKYIPLTQQKHCCFPCCVQWVLLRRGLEVIPQEKIAKDLGLVIPPEDAKLFNLKMKIAKKLPPGKTGYGIWQYKLPSFLKKNKIPLKVKRIYPSQLKNIKKFISNNLSAGNDMIVTFSTTGFFKDRKKRLTHCVVIDTIKTQNRKTIVTLGEPSAYRRKFFNISLNEMVEGMSKKYGREKSFKVFYPI